MLGHVGSPAELRAPVRPCGQRVGLRALASAAARRPLRQPQLGELIFVSPAPCSLQQAQQILEGVRLLEPLESLIGLGRTVGESDRDLV